MIVVGYADSSQSTSSEQCDSTSFDGRQGPGVVDNSDKYVAMEDADDEDEEELVDVGTNDDRLTSTVTSPTHLSNDDFTTHVTWGDDVTVGDDVTASGDPDAPGGPRESMADVDTPLRRMERFVFRADQPSPGTDRGGEGYARSVVSAKMIDCLTASRQPAATSTDGSRIVVERAEDCTDPARTRRDQCDSAEALACVRRRSDVTGQLSANTGPRSVASATMIDCFPASQQHAAITTDRTRKPAAPRATAFDRQTECLDPRSGKSTVGQLPISVDARRRSRNCDVDKESSVVDGGRKPCANVVDHRANCLVLTSAAAGESVAGQLPGCGDDDSECCNIEDSSADRDALRHALAATASDVSDSSRCDVVDSRSTVANNDDDGSLLLTSDLGIYGARSLFQVYISYTTLILHLL